MKINFRVIMTSLFLNSLAFTNAIKIMPLGDSITQGKALEYSYRPYLWKDLKESGYDVDFVGTLSDAPTSEFLKKFPGFDFDHEGHYGWTTGDIHKYAITYALLKPDIVLCHLGTNDMTKNPGTPEDREKKAIQELEAIISIFREQQPRVLFIVAKIIPSGNTTVNQSILSYHKRLDDLAVRLNKAESPIKMVDQWKGFDTKTDLLDGWHPNSKGGVKMAETWYSALTPILTTTRSIGLISYQSPLKKSVNLSIDILGRKNYTGTQKLSTKFVILFEPKQRME